MSWALLEPVAARPFRGAGRRVAFLLLGASLALPTGCDRQPSPPPRSDAVESTHTTPEQLDLTGICQRGQLRILTRCLDHRFLPRVGLPQDNDRELACRFARAIGLTPVVVCRPDIQDLIPALLAGEGDLIAANLTATDTRRAVIDFTEPTGFTMEHIVGRAREKPLSSPAQLAGREIAVPAGTSFHETLAALTNRFPAIRLRLLPGDLTPDQIMDRLAAGELDLTIEDSNTLGTLAQYRKDIRSVLPLGQRRELGWGLRPQSPQLKLALNNFLRSERRNPAPTPALPGDWPQIRQRGTLRLLTLNEPNAYYIWRGELAGFEYELVREFARQHQLILEVAVAPDLAELLRMLLNGEGDLAAALLTPTPERRALGLDFSRPYLHAQEMVIGRPADRALHRPEDLAGRTVVVHRSSSYWQTAAQWREHNPTVRLQPAPEELLDSEILDRVADGRYDLTILDDRIAIWELAANPNVSMLFPASSSRGYGWAVRRSSPQLLQAINDFWNRNYRSTFYNLTVKKYFTPQTITRTIDQYRRQNTAGQISPYDPLARRLAERYEFDWLLITAQMYRESRFNPRLISPMGARGLMQVMPRTGLEMGFRDLFDPQNGLHAGIRYLDVLHDHYAAVTNPADRLWFALAAYNAGAGHVDDARQLARRMGWNPDQWFGHVERAMLLLAKPQYARQARCGYVRGAEPVAYVQFIRDYHRAYLSVSNRLAE